SGGGRSRVMSAVPLLTEKDPRRRPRRSARSLQTPLLMSTSQGTAGFRARSAVCVRSCKRLWWRVIRTVPPSTCTVGGLPWHRPRTQRGGGGVGPRRHARPPVGDLQAPASRPAKWPPQLAVVAVPGNAELRLLGHRRRHERAREEVAGINRDLAVESRRQQ